MLDRLEATPELVFLLDGQTALLADYLDVRPDRRDRLSALVETGRLVVGPWHVQADELLAGDEALVRNLLEGRRAGAALGGWLPVGYCSDAFGHPAALPTILAGFGISRAVLWRGAGGEKGEEREEGDLFWWSGPDGSRVLAHHLPPDGYEVGAELPAERGALRARWEGLRSVLEARAVLPVLYVPNGADHHALQPDLPAVVRRLQEMDPEDEFVIGSPADYFGALDPLLSSSPRPLPEVRGELRWSYQYTWTLQGTFATRAGLKRAIAEATALLVRYAEPQAALGPGDERALLQSAWREQLLTHSHDVLCGCCADEVAEDAHARARHAAALAREVAHRAVIARLGQDAVGARRAPERWDPRLVLANPSPVPRSEVVEVTVTVKRRDVGVGKGSVDGPGLDVPRHVGLTDPAGRPVPVQALGSYDAWERFDSPRNYPDQDLVRAYRLAVEVRDLPPLGTAAFRVVPDAAPVAPPARVSGGADWIGGDAVRVESGRGGAFRVEFGSGRSAIEGVGELVSEQDVGDTYTFEPVAGDAAGSGVWSEPRVVRTGPLVAVLARDFSLGARVVGTVFARVVAGSNLVRLVVEGVNLTCGHRLRMIVPLAHAADEAVADMLFGPEVRRAQPADPLRFPDEWPVAAAPMHRYVAAGDLLVFARGCHEYEVLPRGFLAVTLFRSVDELSRGDLGARPGHAGWPTATPGACETGEFRVELALAAGGVTPADPAARWTDVETLAEQFHAPPAATMLRWGIDVPGTVAGPRLRGEGFAFTTCKPREDGEGVVLRCVNLTAVARRGAWEWPDPVSRAYRARLDETVERELPLADDRRTIPFEAGPRGVVTVIVER